MDSLHLSSLVQVVGRCQGGSPKQQPAYACHLIIPSFLSLHGRLLLRPIPAPSSQKCKRRGLGGVPVHHLYLLFASSSSARSLQRFAACSAQTTPSSTSTKTTGHDRQKGNACSTSLPPPPSEPYRVHSQKTLTAVTSSTRIRTKHKRATCRSDCLPFSTFKSPPLPALPRPSFFFPSLLVGWTRLQI